MDNMQLRQRIREAFVRSRQTYGSPRLAQMLGCPGRRNRIARIMRAERIFARQRSKYRVATTDSGHGGPIAPGAPANLVVFDPTAAWIVEPEKLASKSKNTPFAGRALKGKVVHTMLRGRFTVREGSDADGQR